MPQPVSVHDQAAGEVIAADVLVDLRRPSEFAQRDDQC